MANWGNIFSRGNVEDRRMFGPTAIGGLGLGGLALVLLLQYLGTGSIDVGTVLDQISNSSVQNTPIDTSTFEGQDSYEVFASTVLGSTDDTWSKVFADQGKTYEKPMLVLFRGSTESACGGADASVGPHYCPEDSTIYLDETFFDQLVDLGGNNGDVAQAYVIAHEVGHHVQHQLGNLDAENSSADSVAIELQADCFAGLWAHSIQDLNVFGPNEIKEAMDEAAAVGDDRIQSTYEGRVNPETWTHGSSAQRVASFTKGYDSGQLSACQ